MKKQKFQFMKVMAQSQAGFSLLEILIALTLMGIAGTFVAGKIFDQLHEGRVKAAKIQMDALKNQLMQFKRKCFAYPTSSQGLEALVSKPSGGGRECKDYPPNGFIEEVPLDPWEYDYAYTSDGRTFNIISYGADGQEGGEGEDADIPLKQSK
ncbi:MAG: type II secretion system major pseudopilin GspG [Bacteriovoracaceae bacterium]